MFRPQRKRAIDKSMVVAAAWVRLHARPHDCEAIAQPIEQPFRLGRVAVGVEQAEAAVDRRRRPGVAARAQSRRDNAGMCGPARVESLRPRSVGQVFH